MFVQFPSVSLAGAGSLSGALATTAWFVPFLLAALAYFNEMSQDPEQQPVRLIK